MSKPLNKTTLIKNSHAEEISNESDNLAFSQVLNSRLSRRSLLQAGGAIGVAAAMPMGLGACAATGSNNASAGWITVADNSMGRARSLGFKGVPTSSADTINVPEGYTARAFYKWGDSVGIAGNMPAFRPDASNTTLDQAVQAGMHHDGMAYFGLPQGAQSNNHGLLAMNHEYVDNGLLFPNGTANWDANKVRKSQNAMGISVVEVSKGGNGWEVVRPSRYARRITPHTLMNVTGPAKGHPLMRTAADASGNRILGTMQNCANGKTPWGTYLTCEENWSDIFVNAGEQDPIQKRYGIVKKDESYRWAEYDKRFDAQANPNEPNRFGWVVEIDPFDPTSTPRKHSALGRFKHEGAEVTITPSGHAAVYMGDDQRFEYVYKFVSKNKYQPGNRAHNMTLLEEGTLYVARFNEDGSGDWLPLVHGQNGLTAANGFADQGEVLVKTRMAADTVGATKMDRPEWITADPYRAGSIYCTLTNNSQRGSEGKPGTDAANPRPDNRFGQIIHWQEANGDGTGHRFSWDLTVLAGRSDATKPQYRSGDPKNADFGSPDGLAFDNRGVLWIQTDVSTSALHKNEYEGLGNNQMLAMIPGVTEVRRFLTGPSGAEITGIAFTPDNKTLFINIQHPGEPSDGDSDPANPKGISSWPDGPSGGRPRAATVVITKNDGGIIGS